MHVLVITEILNLIVICFFFNNLSFECNCNKINEHLNIYVIKCKHNRKIHILLSLKIVNLMICQWLKDKENKLLVWKYEEIEIQI
jgi:hypothetical protein